MNLGDIILYKGKRAEIFGRHSDGNTLKRIHIRMLNNRLRPALHLVSIKSKHLSEWKPEIYYGMVKE